MKISGFIKEDLDGSYVYFIFSRELLYVGETQKITFSRWIQHFYSGGTFTQKVKKFGLSEYNYFEKINLVSVELSEIMEQFDEVRWKTITQAVEHIIHELLLCSSKEMLEAYYHKYFPITERYLLVSDTTRTAPRSLPSDELLFAREYAKEVLKNVYEYL